MDDLGITDKINPKNTDKNPASTWLSGKSLPTLVIALVIINIFLVLWCSYNYGLFDTYPTETALGKTTPNLNRRPKHPSEQSSASSFDEYGPELASFESQLVSCADDSLASAVAAVRPAVSYIRTTVLNNSVRGPLLMAGPRIA